MYSLVTLKLLISSSSDLQKAHERNLYNNSNDDGYKQNTNSYYENLHKKPADYFVQNKDSVKKSLQTLKQNGKFLISLTESNMDTNNNIKLPFVIGKKQVDELFDLSYLIK